MAVFVFVFQFLTALAFLSVGTSLDSINMDLEVLKNIDVGVLGTPNLNRYQATFDVITEGQDSDCQYVLRIEFKKPNNDQAGVASPNFEGVCAPNTGGGNAPDGRQWHAHRRSWMRFPEYVFNTTGFDHMSLYWKPCGLPPKGLRQARYDMNFYTVIPEYRALWICREYKTPSVCRYNQSSPLARGHFSLPRLERDPGFLANMPKNFQPDPSFPEAYQYEGLISYKEANVPQTPSDWALPTLHMSTYDGNSVSWRALLPDFFVSGSRSSFYEATEFYVFPTMPRLPSAWNMTYDAPSGLITVTLIGSAGMCGTNFEEAKQEASSQLRG